MSSTQKFKKGITIWPHRSLSKKGFAIVMAALGVLAFSIGLGFFLMGAWPVIGFLGLELLVVWGAFKLNYRAAQRRQTVTADSQIFEVENTYPNGTTESQKLPTAWARLRVTPSEAPDTSTRIQQKITVASHGVHVPIGEFLHPAETGKLAREVQGMLDQAQAANRNAPEPDWAEQLDETTIRPH